MKNIEESPEQRFRRLAIIRTNAVLEKLRLLGNLSNKRNYSYTDEDIEKIFSALNQQLREVRAKFKNAKTNRFQL